MGSEFSYEDISGNTLDKWTYKRLDDANLNGKEYYVVERFPAYKNSGYTKVKTWFDKETYLPHRSEFTDRKNALMKVQTFGTWDQVGEVWRIGSIKMENVQTGKKSHLIWDKRESELKLAEADFSQRSLQRLID